MNTAVTFRFSFRTRNPTKVRVLYKLADPNAGDIDLSETLELINTKNTNDFFNDLTMNATNQQRLFFKFNYYENSYSTLASYLISKPFQDPIVISDYERVDGEPQNFTIRFKMSYLTYFGQILYVVGSLPELGFWDIKYGLRLFHSGTLSQNSKNNGLFTDTKFNWQVDKTFSNLPATVSYRYVVVNESSEPFIEPGSVRYLQFSNEMTCNFLEFNDVWRWNEPAQSLFSKRLFDETLFVRRSVGFPMIGGKVEDNKVLCEFCAHCGVVGRARRLFVVGSIPELGQWNPAKGAELKPSAELQWTASVTIPRSQFPFEFKFVAVGGADSIVWETHENRSATLSDSQESTQNVTIDSWHISFANLSFHGSGVSLDMTAIMDADLGVICKVADWAQKVGFAAIHLSGLLDTTAMTSEFCSLPLSGFALNPLFADLTEFSSFTLKSSETRESIVSQKIKFMRDLWNQNRTKYDDSVKLFREGNSFWLENYEKLCYKRNQSEPNQKEYFLFVDFVQFFLYSQLIRSNQYARDLNIAVGADINFVVSKQSAEALYQPHLFIQDYFLGIPPTQNNPPGVVLEAYPYNFNLAEDWFKSRINHFSHYFSIIRLESIIRFFRQWIIPKDTSVLAISGHFEPTVSISFAELETWGLWDVERYIHPYLRPQVLQKIFGDDALKIMSIFLNHADDNSIYFKPEFSTEKGLAYAPTSEEGEALRKKYLPQLLRLLNEVLLIKVGDHDYRPRPFLKLAAIEGGHETSYSYSDLPLYHQSPFARLEDEFVNNKQRCLWAYNGRQVLQRLTAANDATFFSDAAGIDGDICDEALQAVGVLPLRVQMEGRSKSTSFDDIRGYPYLSVASPQRDLSVPMRVIWKNSRKEAARLWEEEFWESGEPPEEYEDSVAVNIMKQHCWSASMWVMFPIDSLVGAGRHIVDNKQSKYGMLDIEGFMNDEEARQKISEVLDQTKRK